MPALKAAIEDLKAGRLQAGWEKLERHGVVKEVTDTESVSGLGKIQDAIEKLSEEQRMELRRWLDTLTG